MAANAKRKRVTLELVDALERVADRLLQAEDRISALEEKQPQPAPVKAAKPAPPKN